MYIPEFEIAMRYRKLFDWKRFLSKEKIKNYQKCSTVLSNEFTKRFSFCGQVKYHLKKVQVALK